MSPRRDEMTDPQHFVLPDHEGSTLATVLPSIGAKFGLADATDRHRLPDAKRFVVVLVDGLGWTITHAARGHARWLGRQLADARVITAGAPSTTATSITSLGTGLPAGQHGMVGYSFRTAAGQPVVNALTWDTDLDPAGFQPHPTVFERLGGVATANVSPARFEGSALTLSALRGARFVGVPEEDREARTRAAVAASAEGERSLVYVYERALDHVGHGRGVDSDDWRTTLEEVDAWLGQLRAALPDEVCLVVTGDHGMLDVPLDRRVVMEEEPELMRDLDDVAGEGRFRQLYTTRPDAVASRWQTVLGERAQVLTREQVIAQGWFGPADAVVAERIGDVCVAMREDWAVMTSTLPGEFGLVGMHGSLTAAEMLVPLVVTGGRRG